MTWRILFFCLITITACAGQPEGDTLGAELFGKAVAGNRSTAAYEKEISSYKRYLGLLGAPLVRLDGMPSVRQYLSDTLKFVLGGGVIGAAGVITPLLAKAIMSSPVYSKKLLMNKAGQVRPAVPDVVFTAGGMILATTFLGGIYGLAHWLKAKKLMLNQSEKMKNFLYSWPKYRHNAPTLISTIIEPYYRQIALDGALVLNMSQLSSLYTFLAATINARLRELGSDLAAAMVGKKRSFLQRIKAISW